MSDEQLIQDFVAESQEHLADVEADILAIEAAGQDVDPELVNKVFRAVHSVKGAAGFLGFVTIGELSHSLESVLNLVRGSELTVTSSVTDVLLKAADALRGLINNIATSNDVDVSVHVEALKAVVSGGAAEEVRECMERCVSVPDPAGGCFEVSEHTLQSQQRVGHRLFMLHVDLVADVQDAGATPIEFIQELTALGEIVATKPDWDDCGDLTSAAPLSMPFHLLFGTVLEADLVPDGLGLPAERVHPVDLAPYLDGSDSATTSPPEPSPVAKQPSVAPTDQRDAGSAQSEPAPRQEQAPPAPSPAPSRPAAAAKPTDTSIRVSVSLLDHLMNLAGELVLSRNQLTQAVGNGRTEGLHNVAVQLDRITSELQESIMRTRMQPIATVFGKFPRVVRDLSNQLSKQCELVMHGQEVELDKSIIEAIGDPLTHLVRNAVDHGIETPEQRRGAGKPPAGTITLRAFHQAGKVNIEILDDGTGIDVNRIKQKAVEKGILSAERAKEIGDREALRLILAAGFSTASQVTDVSGRGVGMDVVVTNIEKLGGTVDIDTEPGKGTTMRIRLPLTLAIIPALIVRCGQERFAVPQVSINELVRIKPSEVACKIERVRRAEVLRLRGSLLPLVRLSRVLNQTAKYLDPAVGTLINDGRQHIADRREEDAELEEGCALRSGEDRRADTTAGALNIIVLEAGQLKYGLIVDDLFDSEEIVVKPLGRHVKDSSCLAGATILGDGSVAMILDVAGIGSTAELCIPEDQAGDAGSVEDAQEHETQAILLFTNHPSEQFAVPMGLITRIERIRVGQIDHVGGKAVLQYRGASLPLLSLEDQISAQRRPDSEKVFVVVFKVSKRELGLVAPQLVDIRQIPREVDVSTFAEAGVLGSAIVDGRATRLVDVWGLAQKSHPEWFSERAPTQDAEGRVPTLLLAEDSSFFRRQVASFLENEGYKVVSCEDGEVAWQALQESEEPFDLVVTDIEMPNVDGLELTRRIKSDERFSMLPVVAVTSLAGDADVQRGAEAGVDEYQVKLDRDQLIAAIAKRLKGRRRTAGTSEQPQGAAGSTV